MSTEDQKEQPKAPANPWRNPPIAWCSQHNMHPSDCFYIHNPSAVVKEKSEEDTDA